MVATNEEEVRVAKADYAQKPGEIMFAQSGGGGGWGDPLARDVNAVLQDVLDEYISIDGSGPGLRRDNRVREQ